MLLYILSYGILSLLILLLLIPKVSIFFSLFCLHTLEVLLLYHQVRFSLNLCFLEYIYSLEIVFASFQQLWKLLSYYQVGNTCPNQFLFTL